MLNYLQIVLRLQDSNQAEKYKEHIFDIYNPIFLSLFIFFLLLVLTYVSFKFIYIPLLRKHKEEKENLELKNARLMALFSEMDPNPIIRIKPDGTIAGTNKSALKHFDLTNETLVNINEILSTKINGIPKQIAGNKSTTFNDNINGKYYEINMQGVSVLEMAQLYFYDLTEKKEYEEQMEIYQRLLQDSSAKLSKELEKERGRFARLLHDSISHNLLLIKLGIQNLLEKNKAGDQSIDVKSTIEILDNTIVEAKQIARDIKPVNLEELGLSASLAFMSKKVARESRMQLHLEMPEENVRFDPEIENCIYRVTQESLTNIIKHSKATEFTLNLQKDEESIALIIADNGIGFKPKMLLNKKYISDGMGLMNMQERVERLDGKFYIDSSHNNGTVITIEFPGESLSYE